MRKLKTYVMIPTAVIVEAMENTRALFGDAEGVTSAPRRRKSRRGRKPSATPAAKRARAYRRRNARKTVKAASKSKAA